MTRKTALITFGLIIIAVAVPVTLLLGSRITSFFSGAQEPPKNAFQAFLNSDQAFKDTCPADATCEPYAYYYDCVVFGHIVGKVVDVSSGSEVDITNEFNEKNAMSIDTQHDKSKLWTARIDQNITERLACNSTGRIGAYWGGASCDNGGILEGGSTYTTGKPTEDTNLWCFNGPFQLKVNVPSGYELVGIDIQEDTRGDSGQGGQVDLSNKMVKNINLCNYSYGPGNYAQMTHHYKVRVRRTTPPKPPVCVLKTIPSPAKGEVPFKVSFDGSDSVDSDGSITKYVWKIDNQIVSDKSNFDYTFDKAGKYGVTLVVQDNQSLTSPECSVEVTATSTPVPNPPVCIIETVPSPAQGDAPLTVKFDGSKSVDSDGSITKYVWKIAGQTVSTGMTFERTFDQAGTYDVTLQVTDNQNLTSPLCKVVVSPKQKDNVRPVCKIVSNPANPGGNVPQSVSFDGSQSTDADGTISKYTWTLRKDNADLKTFSTDKFDYNFTLAGQYQLLLTVADNQNVSSDQCTLNFVLSTAVTPTPTPTPTATPTIIPTSVQKYMTCEKERCVQKTGNKASTCSVDKDCDIKHYMTCENDRCVEKEGDKVSVCDVDKDCVEKKFTTCDWATQRCVVKEGNQPSTCDSDRDCRPQATSNPVPHTGGIDNSMKAAIVSAASLVIIGLLLIL